jgi:cardiolipin synthase
MKTALVLCYFVTWVTIPHLLLLKKRPAATLAWLWAILFMPFLGAAYYCLFGTDRLKRRRLKHRSRLTAHPAGKENVQGTTDDATADLLQRLPAQDRRFLGMVSRINQLPISSAGESRVLNDASEFYPALEQKIQKASRSVHLEFYLWRGDQTGLKFLSLLTETARRGVKVRLLLDGVGSFGLRRNQLNEFRAAGGEFAWFQGLDPKRGRFVLNLRDHRKLQIIDNAVAFVGGMNIGREYEGLDPRFGAWRDVQVEVTGAIVGTLQDAFADDWYFATGKKINELQEIVKRSIMPVQVILGGADRPNEPMSKSFVSLLQEAGSRVWIATGYFVPDDVLLSALELAAARGVDVRLLVARKNNYRWLVTAGRSYYDQLLNAGVRIFEYTAGTYHAKFVVADKQWAMIGSANFDYRSMRLNFELNLLFHSPSHNAALAGRLEADFLRSQEIDPGVFARRAFYQRFAEAALRPLSPML